MLLRITGPGFVAGLVVDEDDMVRVSAPILRWAIGLSVHSLRAELKRRGYTATICRTLTRSEITGKPKRLIRPERDDDNDDSEA
jgi:hypothetical protein